MLENQLDDLEKRITHIEEQMEEHIDFDIDPMFETLYYEMIDLSTVISDDIEGFSYETMSEKSENRLMIQRQRFIKLKKRIAIIKNDANFEI